MEIIKIDKYTPVDLQKYVLRSIQILLVDLECCYPHFSQWLDKVFCEVRESSTRKVLLCVNDGLLDIAGVAIIKDTKQEKKICTLRVLNHYQNRGFGSALLARSIEELRDPRPLITVSGIQMSTFGRFLKKRGFVLKNRVKSLYRKGVYEYFFNKPYEHQVVLLSIKPEYAKAIEQGLKQVEFRKKPIAQSVKKVYVYATSPVQRIIGYFVIQGVECDNPEKLWKRFSHVGAIDKKKYDKYFNGKDKAYGIIVSEYNGFPSYKNPKDFDCTFKAPQSFVYVDNIECLKWLSD